MLLQSVLNLMGDIHVMVNWQLSKKSINRPVSHDCIAGSHWEIFTFYNSNELKYDILAAIDKVSGILQDTADKPMTHLV